MRYRIECFQNVLNCILTTCCYVDLYIYRLVYMKMSPTLRSSARSTRRGTLPLLPPLPAREGGWPGGPGETTGGLAGKVTDGSGGNASGGNATGASGGTTGENATGASGRVPRNGRRKRVQMNGRRKCAWRKRAWRNCVRRNHDRRK